MSLSDFIDTLPSKPAELNKVSWSRSHIFYLHLSFPLAHVQDRRRTQHVGLCMGSRGKSFPLAGKIAELDLRGCGRPAR